MCGAEKLVSAAMAPVITICELTPDDSADVAALHALCFADAWDAKTFSDWIARPEYSGFVVCADDHESRCIGFIVLRTVCDESEIITLATAPEHQGQGVASALVQHAIDDACAHHCKQVFLEVRESNAAARGLYTKQGFAISGIRKNYYPSPKDGRENAVVMCRVL